MESDLVINSGVEATDLVRGWRAPSQRENVERRVVSIPLCCSGAGGSYEDRKMTVGDISNTRRISPDSHSKFFRIGQKTGNAV
jgi:hypothetical protein